jgi:hypothetical protein
LEQSRTLLEESLTLTRRSGNQALIGLTLFNLGSLARVEGDVRKGEALVKESVVAFRESGNRANPLAAICFCGVLAIKRGSYRRGARLLGAVDPRYARLWWLLPDDRRAYEESLSAARASLGDDDFSAAWTEGKALTLEQAVAFALSEEGPQS